MDVIDHVAITVKDIPTSIQWYTERFECRVEWEDETWALLAFANCKLALVTPNEHPPHFAVLRQDLTPFGSPKKHRDGTASVYQRDVDNNYIEFLHRPELDERSEGDATKEP